MEFRGRLVIWIAAFIVGGVGWADAQPNFTNLETPQVRPITTATVGSGDLRFEVVLICNTPDNSVELRDANAPYALYQRIAVGKGPCTVHYDATLRRFYTCNFDGDTVTTGRLEIALTPQGREPRGFVEATSFVGDQPADIAINAEANLAVVSLAGRSSFATINATNLNLIAPETLFELNDPSLPAPLALKKPWAMEGTPGGRMLVLNHMGETPDPALPVQYDMDIWVFDPAAVPQIAQITGLASTNYDMALTTDGGTAVVVGAAARNHDGIGEAAVAALPFGFVESRFWVIDVPPGGTPLVHPDAPPGVLPPAALPSRNLNRDYSVTTDVPVAPMDALSQPTSVLILEAEDGSIDRIILTAFQSDKVALFTPANVPGGYIETQVPLSVFTPSENYSMVGPRGLATHATTGLIYVACRLDNSLRVIDPTTNSVVGGAQLGNDPTPDIVRVGRQFLYDATNSSGNGFTACGSCHIDSGTDGLPWDLGEVALGPPIPPSLIGSGPASAFPNWPSEKGPLITQTLQGLLNYPVNPAGEYLITNAPYHWRGDRANFQAFNPAFVGLLGRAQQLSTDEMNQYTAFINTVRHPPNPEQAIDRIVPGTLDPIDPDDWMLAAGSKLGQQIFFNNNSDAGRSCADCHRPVEGSDNLLTEAFPVPLTITGSGTQDQPIETAALRNVVPRESWLHRSPGLQPTIWGVANSGLTHDGNLLQGSINFFNNFFFSTTVPGGTPDEQAANLEALTQYTRQFDWSIAPGAGLAYTLRRTDPTGNAVAFNYFEGQVEDANIGLAVYARQGLSVRGFWYDITVNPPAYREEGTTNIFTRAQIEAMTGGSDSAVILQGTHLGSDRRMANPSGVATLIANDTAPPANLVLEAMAPMSYYTDVPLFQQFLQINTAAVPPFVTASPETSVWAERTFQLSVLGSFGVNTLHHEPPRRFRVSGDNIRPGAQLLIGIPTTNPGAFPVQVLQVDLYPTGYTNADGDQIWESEQEIDSIITLALLNGGPFAPDVVNVALRQTTTPNLQPALWNSYAFAVVNEDGTINSTISFSPLTVQDTR